MKDTLLNPDTPDQLKAESGSSAQPCAAFPDPCGARQGAFPPNEQKGMTLRDYFAAKAMAAMMTHDAHKHDWSDAKVAGWAYATADAMMNFRENDQSLPPADTTQKR